jgi:Calx-beta domain
MKKNIIKLASLLFAVPFFLVSCEEDVVTYNGSEFVTLTDVNFSTLNVTETSGTVSIPVQITNPQSGDVTVNFTITSDDATEGVNYTVLTPSIVIPAGQTSATFQLQVIDDLDFNTNRTVNFEITSTSVSTIGVGIADVGSYMKAIVIGNDDYDCDTQFNYWLGALSIEDVGYNTISSSGVAGTDCDLLTVTGNISGWDSSTPENNNHVITFVADDASGETGTVSVHSLIDAGYTLSSGASYDVYYDGEGVYDTTTGEITIDYSVNAYTGSTSQGYFYTGTTIITRAN